MSEFRRKLMMAYAANLGRGDITYPGLIAAWSAKGKTNDDEDRAILKDLTGNGHDITLNNFSFSGMSGYGGYQYNWLTDLNMIINEDILNITHNKLKLTKSTNGWGYVASLKIDSYKNKSFRLNVHYETKTNVIFLQNQNINIQLNEGINIIPVVTTTFNINFSVLYKTIAEIELLPEYPDALVFDGVDDKGICSNIPILDKYTLICKRTTFIDENLNRWRTTICFGDNTSNISELVNKIEARNYVDGKINNITRAYNSDGIYFNTKETYNGLVSLTKGELPATTNNLYLGILNNNSYLFKGAFYSAYLFDRSLDEQEIKSFIRKYIDSEYLLPSEIPTPDCYYDFSLGSNDDENRETIKDQSGNGNDAKAYNFAWNEEGSGYKDGALYLDGTDDYIALEAFDSGFKTVFMLCSWKIENVINYDQRNNNDYENSLNTSSQDINYYGRNRSGKTYINGILSTKVKNNLTRNKKHLITGTFFGGSNTTTPCIGSNNSGNGYFSNLTLYKFLGFKEELTEEQIKAIIKKYNLLDGVDEIEVS